MQNSENEPLPLSFASKNAVAFENKLLVAVTVAAVVLAGSAIAYRRATDAGSTRRLFWNDPHTFDEKSRNENVVGGSVDPDAVGGLPAASTSATTYATVQELEYNASSNTAMTKSSRSKDRRKRGKDPLREVLKSGKKLKSFPIPAGSSSTPSSPQPSAAVLSSSPVGKGTPPGEDTDLYSSFEAGSSSAALQTQVVDPSHVSHEHQQNAATRRQREKSPTTLATPVIYLSATAHSRDTSDMSQTSRFSHDGEDNLANDEDADFSTTSSYRQYENPHIQSPNSLTQSSLSRPHSPSSLADVSEAEQEHGGWVTSVSKSRSRHRTRLADVFDDIRSGTSVQGRDGLENRANEVGMAKGEGQTRGYPQQIPLAAETCSNTVEVEEPSMLLQSNGAPIAFSPMQSKQECQTEPPDLFHWDTTTIHSQSSASSSVKPGSRDISSNEAMSTETEDKVQANDEDRKQLRSPPKGSTSNASFSSAVGGVKGGGRVVIGRCQTVSDNAAVASKGSVSGSRLTETDDGSGAPPEDGETEFTFPTLNSQAGTSSSGPSARTRSTLIGASANSSSPSKKNKRHSSKSGTPPPNAPPSRTSSPSSIRENHTTSHAHGPNVSGASNMPALSAQTQLASLRGALEAARLREEKHKTEMEMVMKEMETLKWESTNSQRGELELRAQVRQLTHQLQSYAALFSSVAPHHFAMQFPLSQPHSQGNDSHTDANADSDINPPEPGSSPKVDPGADLPNGGVDPEFEPQVTAIPEDEAVPSSDKAQDVTPTSPQSQQPVQLPSSSASPVDGPSPVQPHPRSPPSAAIPFFPYPIPYMPTQPSRFPVHPPPWMYHHYQSQQSTQNVSGTASGPSLSQPSQHYPNIYSPMMYPISPVAPPLSPPNVGMVPHSLFHQHQPFGFGGGLRSAGASSTGSHSPELTSLPSGLNKQKQKMKRRKSQMANLNGNARTGWEDVGDGWIGLSKVATQPAANNAEKGGRLLDEGAMADGEGDEDVDSRNSPYSELLADAILKRSSTIRPSKKNGKKENNDPLDTQEGGAEVEPFTEFTFPSLSDFSNVYYRTASRTESSISSSLSSSPPSTAATVPDSIGDQKWEESDKASLPPVIEKSEDSDSFTSDAVMQDTEPVMASSKIQNIVVDEDVTPKEEHEQSLLTDSKLEQ